MSKKVLLVIDTQKDFIDGSLGSADAVAVVPKIIERIKNVDYNLILFTRDTHFENYLETAEGKKLPVKHCISDTPGWEIYPEILDAAEEVLSEHGDVVRGDVIDKPTFGSREVADYLCNYALDNVPEDENLEIEVLGFCTDICVISNVLILKAALYETANISVNSTCCAGVTPELHKAALDVMKSCQIDII